MNTIFRNKKMKIDENIFSFRIRDKVIDVEYKKKKLCMKTLILCE